MATQTIVEVLPDAAGNMPVDIQNWPTPPANSPPFAAPVPVTVGNFPAAPTNSPPFAAPPAVAQSGVWTVAVSSIAGSENVTVGNWPTALAPLPVSIAAGAFSVSNFPTTYNVGNFPAGFNVNNWPATPVQNLMSTPSVGAANFNTNQATASQTASILVPARVGAPGTGRCSVTIVNETGTDKLILGNSTVTAATGFVLPAVAGESITIDSTAAIWGLVPTTPQNVTWFETY